MSATTDELKLIITAQNMGVTKALDSVKKQVESLSGSVEKNTQRSSASFDKLKLVALAAAAAIGVMVKSSIQQFGDFEQNLGGVLAVYGKFAKNITAKAEGAANAVGLSASVYMQTANLMGAMFQGVGYDIEESMIMTTNAMQRGVDVASVLGLTNEYAMDAIKAMAKGNFTLMDNLGVAMTNANLEAYALSKGIEVSIASMDTAGKVALAYTMFMDRTTYAAGNFAREGVSTMNGALSIMNANLKNLQSSLGSFLAPLIAIIAKAISYITIFANSIAKLFGAKTDLSKVSDNTENIADNANSVSTGFDEAAKSAKQLKNQLAGFHKLNVLSEPSGSSNTAVSSPVTALPDLDVAPIAQITDEFEKMSTGMKIALSLLTGIATAFAGLAGAAIIAKLFGSISSALGVGTGKLLGWGAGIALVAAGIVMLTSGADKFEQELGLIGSKMSTLPNTMQLVGAAAIALGAIIMAAMAGATAGVSLIIGAVAGIITVMATFVSNEIKATSAENKLKSAQEARTKATNDQKAAQDALNGAIETAASSEERRRTATAELNALMEQQGITQDQLNSIVVQGELDVESLTDAELELYNKHLEVKSATDSLKDAQDKQRQATQDLQKAEEDLAAAEDVAAGARFELQHKEEIELAKQSGNWDDYKKKVVEAFESGELKAEGARQALGVAFGHMSDDAEQTFIEDLPKDIKDGLDPNKYETTGQKLKDWFSSIWSGMINGASDALGKVVGFFGELWGKIKEKIGEIAHNVGEVVSGAFKGVVNGVLSIIEDVFNAPIRLINGAIDVINKIPGVNIGKIGEMKLPRMATGGIVDRATLAVVGESGREAVLPLDNNTSWMDKLAEKIGGGQPVHITVNIGENTLIDKVIDGINDASFARNASVINV